MEPSSTIIHSCGGMVCEATDWMVETRCSASFRTGEIITYRGWLWDGIEERKRRPEEEWSASGGENLGVAGLGGGEAGFKRDWGDGGAIDEREVVVFFAFPAIFLDEAEGFVAEAEGFTRVLGNIQDFTGRTIR